MKNDRIYTCYGCPHFYKDNEDLYATKHCNKNHFECPYYWGNGELLGLKEKEVAE